MSTPEPRTTATDGLTLGDGHQHVAKGKKHREQEGIHPIKIHHNEGNQVTGQHQSPWQALGGLAPTVSAAPQGEPIPDDKNLKRISIVHSEAAQFDILTANISSSTAIISSSHTDMLSVPSAADASKKPRNRLSINFFGRSGTNSDDKVKQETNLAAAPKFSRADKEAFAYAVAIRNLSLPAATGHTSNNMVSRRADLKKIKDKMLDPTSAATIVNYLRRLPPSNDSTVPSIETVATLESKPTQLVSLSMTDEEADKLFSSRLRTSSKSRIAIVNGEGAAPVSMHNASLSSIFDTIKDLQLVSYLGTGGNFGFGDSVDDQPSAILSGSIPSSATLMTGLTEIAKAIFSLGYASDELPYPSHKDVHPPTDRTSVMTCRYLLKNYHSIGVTFLSDIWGFEICIPHDSVIYLGVSSSVTFLLSSSVYISRFAFRKSTLYVKLYPGFLVPSRLSLLKPEKSVLLSTTLLVPLISNGKR